MRATKAASRLKPAFRRWVVENAARGVSLDEIVIELAERGLPKRDARRLALETLASTDFTHALAARVHQLELLVRLRRELRAPALERGIERRSAVSAEELFDRYFAEGRPLVLTGAMRSFPRWTPQLLRERFARLPITFHSGRDGDPDYDRNAHRHLSTTTMGAFVDRVLASGPTNDFYAIARGKNLQKKSWAKLLDEVPVDEAIFDRRRLRMGSSFWFGPAGTVTPLHHDSTNILFHQVYGRKKFLLAPPEETDLLVGARDFYAAGDPEREDLGVPFREVVLAPGEALFIPAGWWHHVRAIDVSISFSLLCFRRRNDFDWFRPARAVVNPRTF